jgi:hypothetical protein
MLFRKTGAALKLRKIVRVIDQFVVIASLPGIAIAFMDITLRFRLCAQSPVWGRECTLAMIALVQHQ